MKKSELRKIIREEIQSLTEKEGDVYIEFQNSKNGFRKDKKIFKGKDAYAKAMKWMKATFEPQHVNSDLIKYENINEDSKDIVKSDIKLKN